MAPRIPDVNALLPEFPKLAGELVRVSTDSSLPATTLSLVYLRAGQIVGSTYQVTRHAEALRAAGESEARITAVATWWDAPFFTAPERAALALTDAVFQPAARGAERVPDALYGEVAEHYDDKAMATLMVVLASAGFWMAIALVHKPDPVA